MNSAIFGQEALPATKFLRDYLSCFKKTRRHFLAKWFCGALIDDV